MIQDLVLRLKGAVDSAAQAMPGLIGRVTAAAKVAAGILSALAAAMVAATLSAANYADELAKTARASGLLVEELMALRHAAHLAGVETSLLSPAIATLQRQLQAAAGGSKEAQAALQRVGLSARDIDAPIGQTFGRLLDGLARLPAGAKRSATAMILLGEAGARMETLIRGGSAGLAEARKQLEERGALLDDSTTAQAEAFNDELALLQLRVGALATALGRYLVPVGRRLIAFLDALAATAAPVVLDAIDIAAQLAGSALDAMLTPLGAVAALLAGGAAAVQIHDVATSLLQIAASGRAGPVLAGIASALGGITLATVGQVVAAIGVLLLTIDDLMAYMRGAPSIIGDVVAAFQRLGAWLMQQEGVPELLTALQDVSAVMAYLGGVVVGELIGQLSRLYDALYPIWSVFAELAGFTFENLGEFVSIVAKMFGGAIGAGVAGAGAAVSGDAQSRAAAEAAASGVLGPLGGAGVRALAAGASGVRGNNLGGVLAAAQRGVAVGQQGRAAVRQDIAINVTGVTGDQVAQQIARQLDTTFAAAAAAGG